MKQSKDGKIVPALVPEGYLVLKVLERKDARALTFEEAKLQLMAKSIVGEMIKKLRSDHKVAVYEDKLPDPQQYTDPTKDPLMQ
jgi:hypothetical protein